MHNFMESEANHQPQNPAQDPILLKRDKRNRIPMSIPQLKLEVPEIPGWHLYWALENNLNRFLQAGYELVHDKEVPINQKGIGSDVSMTGNADLGTLIKVVAGVKETGDTDYFVLVKIEEEYYREDQKKIEDHNRRILRGIFKQKSPVDGAGNPGDTQQRYVAQADVNRSLNETPLFQRRQKKHV
jgi:hypothetical protein